MLLDELNDAQRAAAAQTEGAVMIVAGAGSGKTRTLTYRVAHLLEKGVSPFSILLLTFTNKAAKEMRERIESLVGNGAKSILMGTFHSVAARILRLEAEKLGYTKNFVIYDTSDSKTLLKNIIKDRCFDSKIYVPSFVLDRISKAKSSLISAAEYAEDPIRRTEDAVAGKPAIAELYLEYERRLKRAVAMDFDDLLFNLYRLLTLDPSVADKYSQRFRYIMVDEYQDTNHAQYLIVKKLASRHKNVCVVGDDAQSIYAFRGANIQNILNFKKDYEEVRIYKLEQNYRSSQNIVNAANSVIDKNLDRIKKNVWTSNPEGEKITFKQLPSDRNEAEEVCNRIKEKKSETSCSYGDIAILYRTNSQSRAFEDALRLKNVPYVLYGGISFYSRKEIKDVLAYFRLVVNHHDDDAFARVVNYPQRGIGQTTIDRLKIAADAMNCSLFVAASCENLEQFGIKGATSSKLSDFCAFIKSCSVDLYNEDALTLGEKIIHRSRIIDALKEEDKLESKDRVENVEELINGLQSFVTLEDTHIIDELTGELVSVEQRTLDVFLQQISLISDMDKEDDNPDKVSLMTIHSSKGLEFDHVFIVGMEENLFPSTLCLASRTELEEERRLFYVALTRAKQSVFLSSATMRYKFGQVVFSEKSRFIDDIDTQYLSGDGVKKALPISASSTQLPKKKLPITQKKSLPITSLSKNILTKQATNEPVGEMLKIEECQEGLKVWHSKFGTGVIKTLEGKGLDTKAVVEFEGLGEKTLILRFAKLKKIEQ
ncbi:MAG: 3'-5' exonuclease [Bacteroidales bacterium]|nr:3'-5' exonuclease [Bacteroidales bacterium]